MWKSDVQNAQMPYCIDLADFFTQGLYFMVKFFLENSTPSIKKLLLVSLLRETQISQGFLKKELLKCLPVAHFSRLKTWNPYGAHHTAETKD